MLLGSEGQPQGIEKRVIKGGKKIDLGAEEQWEGTGILSGFHGLGESAEREFWLGFNGLKHGER